jgi:uncharacterized OsmC-like protein
MATTINGLEIDALRETVGEIEKDPGLGCCQFRLTNEWKKGAQNVNHIHSFYGARQEMQHQQTFDVPADEPPIIAGQDTAVTPTEYLLAALASCVTSSLVLQASLQGIELGRIESEVQGDLDLNGFMGLQDVPKGYQKIRVDLHVDSDADPKTLHDLASASPTLHTIEGGGTEVDLKVQKLS